MRKIIVFIHSTFNGVVTGPNNDKTNFMTWAQTGIDDINDSFHEHFATVDTILLGRGTYEDLSTKWPFVKTWPAVGDVTLRLGEIINNTRKIVVSGNKNIDDIKWGEFNKPTQLVGKDIEGQIEALKKQPGGDIITFGSPTLVQSLTNADLIDEYRVLVHPVIVGEGGRLFDHIEGRKDLRLKSTKTFEHGAMLVQYELAARP
jgi:dihydrofolate reductase